MYHHAHIGVGVFFILCFPLYIGIFLFLYNQCKRKNTVTFGGARIVRSSPRLRLKRGEDFYLDHISLAEYERQAKNYTKDSVSKLTASKEYKKMKKNK